MRSVRDEKRRNMTENELTYQIRGAIWDVYNDLGPGLLESVYEEALSYETCKRILPRPEGWSAYRG